MTALERALAEQHRRSRVMVESQQWFRREKDPATEDGEEVDEPRSR